ncbi:unnamed protein product [Rotaria magnacalcarata]|uniref:Transmembrane protein n=2 Tax=Rotaria magnacalcarata TaxID=392030 RepID=A0A816UCE7_9BILA|nr:unnamed protein product [Rotaria magnacalcarata]CAF1578163.1 unnamed protein product [Rotaria magnacalcarata]CAF2088253.1 unnamed protein product [Rotaria magnacalcarata]CAF2112247.1 unnamed protein product [Rotaria magnacalcarata]CAF4008871.1 unnamed protein product [Rotaria magnacalcarata]
MDMILAADENIFSSQIQSITIHLLSTIFSALIISVGLVVSTEISGYNLETMYYPVSKETCTCDCWDGYFRGRFPRGHYKIFYFNYEQSIIILLCILLFYGELLRKFLFKIIFNREFILLLLIPSVYSNFYGVWSIINYINDQDYDRMLKSQSYFSLTELIATFIFYQCLTMKSKIPSWLIYFLCTISCLHIFLAFGELNLDQMGRNFALVLSDIISLIWIIIMFIKNPRLKPNLRTTSIWLFVALCLWLFYHFVCQFREKNKNDL